MIGARASWRHKNPDGTPVKDLAGTILEFSHRPTTGAWHALLLCDDGTLQEAEVKHLIVDESDRPSAAASPGLDLSSLLALIEREFPGLDPVEGESPMARVMRVIVELKRELVAESERADGLLRANEMLKASKRKPKGPAGPGEEEVK